MTTTTITIITTKQYITFIIFYSFNKNIHSVICLLYFLFYLFFISLFSLFFFCSIFYSFIQWHQASCKKISIHLVFVLYKSKKTSLCFYCCLSGSLNLNVIVFCYTYVCMYVCKYNYLKFYYVFKYVKGSLGKMK